MKLLIKIATVFLGLSAGSLAHAEVFTTQTTNGRALSLHLPEFPVTRKVKALTICAEPQSAVTLAKLWMPGMGHGSAPTQLSPGADGCTNVANVQFMMRGEWEIQVTLSDGDQGVFDVLVQ